MAKHTNPGMSGKRLAGPDRETSDRASDRTAETGPLDLARRREEAKRIAVEKARSRTLARRRQIADRIAAASEEIASAITEGSGAAKQLSRAMEQIAAGAHQASGAGEQSRAAVSEIARAALANATLAAESLRRLGSLKTSSAAAAEILRLLIDGATKAADTAAGTAERMNTLVRQSEEIGEIIQTVMRIADQTGLLALNAAIEAAKAEEHGLGFAVVADEVRLLAEAAEKSARTIREVIEEIQNAVRRIVGEMGEIGTVSRREAENGKRISDELGRISAAMDRFLETGEKTTAGIRQITADAEALLGMAENVASSAEQIASSTEEASRGTAQQFQAFAEMSGAADELAGTADDLRGAADTEKSAADLGSMAEELSANIEEAGAAAQQLSRAIDQIRAGAEDQSKETIRGQEIADRLRAVITEVSEDAREIGTRSDEMRTLLAANRERVTGFLDAIHSVAADNLRSAGSIRELDERSLAITKIADSITNITIQTNMLAVTGAIEAARAGENGRGFAHVASDIRKLAVESSAQADRIKDIARRLQYTVSRSAQEIETAGAAALQEAERARSVTDGFDRIESDMNEVGVSLERMRQNQEEAKSAIDQIAQGIGQIGSAALEAVHATTGAAAAAEQQSRGIQDMIQAIEAIASLADELQEL